MIDIGPGEMLQKIAMRYNWSDIRVIGPNDTLVQPVVKASQFGTSLARTQTPVSNVKPPVGPLAEGGNVQDVALRLFTNMFGYDEPNKLLEQSLHSIGVQSMDYIRFAQKLEDITGARISISAFSTDSTLGHILNSVARR